MLQVRVPGLSKATSRLFRTWRPVFRRLVSGTLTIQGYFPIGSEQAVGADEPDRKSFFDFVPGMNLPEPLLSTAAEVHGLLLCVVRGQIDVIADAIAPTYAERLTALVERAPTPILRITYCQGNQGCNLPNYPHADIDLLTLLPPPTGPGLEIASDAGWREPPIADDSAVVITGEMLELLGGPAAEVHRVVGDRERLSAALFVNASPDERLPDGRLAGAVVQERLRTVARGSHRSSNSGDLPHT